MKFSGSRAGAGAPILQGRSTARLEIDDARVSYFGQLPVAEHVSGSATFDGARFDIAVKSGICQNLAIQAGTIAITGLDGDDHRIAIDLQFGGQIGRRADDHRFETAVLDAAFWHRPGNDRG